MSAYGLFRVIFLAMLLQAECANSSPADPQNGESSESNSGTKPAVHPSAVKLPALTSLDDRPLVLVDRQPPGGPLLEVASYGGCAMGRRRCPTLTVQPNGTVERVAMKGSYRSKLSQAELNSLRQFVETFDFEGHNWEAFVDDCPASHDGGAVRLTFRRANGLTIVLDSCRLRANAPPFEVARRVRASKAPRTPMPNPGRHPPPHTALRLRLERDLAAARKALAAHHFERARAGADAIATALVEHGILVGRKRFTRLRCGAATLGFEADKVIFHAWVASFGRVGHIPDDKTYKSRMRKLTERAFHHLSSCGEDDWTCNMVPIGESSYRIGLKFAKLVARPELREQALDLARRSFGDAKHWFAQAAQEPWYCVAEAKAGSSKAGAARARLPPP